MITLRPVLLALIFAGTGSFATGLVSAQPHIVTASSFADPADVAAYRKCVAHGASPKSCLAIGDNGIGLWGDDTTKLTPMCALPREDWQERWGKGRAARGKKIRVSYRGKIVICELRDTMPARANRHNPAGIDLNPGAARAFGWKPPFMVKNVGWEWAE